jgi:protein involved in polysaccharide export with SLBB domain
MGASELGIPILVPSGMGRAEDAAMSGSSPIAGPVNPEVYRVGPGDVLQLQLWGRVSRSWTLTVGPEGTVVIPGSGTQRIAGRTLADVRADVLARVRSQFRGVNMDLRLARPRQFIIYLTGQVKGPGPSNATGNQRVADVVNPGTVADNASLRHIEVRHTDGSRETADIDLFLRTGLGELNPWLRDGDIVYVPVATDFIYAQGAIARPGRFELGPRDSLLTLFRLAGDPIPAADIARALLLRWKDPFTPESLWVRLDDVYSGRVNPVLREGDRVYVYYLPQYHLQHEATITGEVARPGSFPIVEGRHHLSDLIRAAGGFLPTADLSAIRVHRRSPTAGDRDPELERLLRLTREQLSASEYGALRTKQAAVREDYSVDWNRLAKSPKDLDLLLRDGDMVRVERLVNSIRIDGEVKRPGILTYRPGLGVGDYVRQAGGFTNRAWASRIRVTRAVTGQVLPARDVRSLDPGDFVWVPDRPDRTVWDQSRELLTALAQIATVIIAIRSIK